MLLGLFLIGFSPIGALKVMDLYLALICHLLNSTTCLHMPHLQDPSLGAYLMFQSILFHGPIVCFIDCITCVTSVFLIDTLIPTHIHRWMMCMLTLSWDLNFTLILCTMFRISLGTCSTLAHTQFIAMW